MIVAALDALSDNGSDGVLSCREEPDHDILDACLDAIADDDGPSDAELVIAVSVDELANVALDGLSDTVSEVGSVGNHIVEIGSNHKPRVKHMKHFLANLDVSPVSGSQRPISWIELYVLCVARGYEVLEVPEHIAYE